MGEKMICITPAIHVDEINDPAQLESLRLSWQALFSETPRASFFHSLDWLQTSWTHFGAGHRLRILVVSRGTRAIGILPLIVRREKTRIGSMHVLTYPLTDWGSWFGPIGPNPTATLISGLRHIAQTPRDWDLLDLRWVDRDRLDHTRTPSAMQQTGLQPHERIWKTAAIVELNGNWQDYWSSRSAKFRQNIMRERRRLSEQGVVRHIRYRPRGRFHGEEDPRWDLYDACRRLAELSWQSEEPDGTLIHDDVADFFRDAHFMAARNGMLDMNLLTLNDRPVAYAYNYHHEGRLFGLRIGYDPVYKRFGVGNVLSYELLKDSAERKDVELDLGSGSMHVKLKWATRLAQIYHYTHYPISAPRSQLLRFKHWTDKKRHFFAARRPFAWPTWHQAIELLTSISLPLYVPQRKSVNHELAAVALPGAFSSEALPALVHGYPGNRFGPGRPACCQCGRSPIIGVGRHERRR